jgi:hypothetical protein
MQMTFKIQLERNELSSIQRATPTLEISGICEGVMSITRSCVLI